MEVDYYKYGFLGLLGISIILLFIFIGRNTKKCPSNNTIYKYIPRTPEEEAKNPIDIEDIFKPMFSEPSPWVGTFRSNNIKKGG
jgi:hypothetical protein